MNTSTTSTAESLATVLAACQQVASNLSDLDNEHPHTLKKLTLPGGRGAFRFTTIVEIDGVQVEVQVRGTKGGAQ
jgi:hypothetical protein